MYTHILSFIICTTFDIQCDIVSYISIPEELHIHQRGRFINDESPEFRDRHSANTEGSALA